MLLLNTLSWYPHVYKTNLNSLVRNSRGLFQSHFLFFPNTNLSSSTHLISSFFLQIRLALSYLCTFIFPLPHTRMPSLSSPIVFFLLCCQGHFLFETFSAESHPVNFLVTPMVIIVYESFVTFIVFC